MNTNGTSDHDWIVRRSADMGFDLCGVVRGERFPELARTGEWLERGYAGEMSYLADQRRTDPQSVMPQLRSVIVCALNYNAPFERSTDDSRPDDASPRGWISRYAWGEDYHGVLEQKLRALAAALRERFAPPFEARVYSDTGPINERVFAKHAGLGWIGKNTLLLNSRAGSWFFLGAILTTLDISPTLGPADSPPTDLCGSCRRCLEACPTGALVEPYVMDSRLCIAYLTIELRGSIPERLREAIGRHVFGCDICQDVCPWNRRAPVTQAQEFQPRTFSLPVAAQTPAVCSSAVCASAESRESQQPKALQQPQSSQESLFLPHLEWLASMSEEQFRAYFRGSPLKRAKWRGLVRNACIALGNAAPARDSSERQSICELLTELSSSPEPIISESAQWALSRIQ